MTARYAMSRGLAAALVVAFGVSVAAAQTASPSAPGNPAAGKPAQSKPAQSKPVQSKPAPKAAAKPAAEAGPCELGVVSAVGHVFTRQKIGIMVFGNEHTPIPSGAWGFDDLVFGRVQAAAGRGSGVRRIGYPPGAFERYENPEPMLFRNRDDDLAAVVRTVTAGTRCARYLVVTRATSQFLDTNQVVSGLGIVNYGGPLVSSNFVFALTVVRIYDGTSFALLATERSLTEDRTLATVLLGGPIRGPAAHVDKSWWPETPDTPISPAVRTRTRELLAQSLDHTLPKFFGH